MAVTGHDANRLPILHYRLRRGVSLVTEADTRPPLARFWAPRYWPTWALWLALRAAARLRFETQLKLGRRVGPWLGRFKKRQAKAARKNLSICFPELSAREREALLRRHFQAVGISFFEMAMGWFLPADELRRLVRVEGKQHLDAALARGKGALLVGAHFTPLEVCVAILQDVSPRTSTLYRPQRNAMMDAMIHRGRSRFAQTQIPRDNVRALLRRLRANDTVAYMPDQTNLGNQSTLLPFFGEPAVTNIAVAKLAKISGASVMPFFFLRRADDSGYDVSIGAPFDNFPSNDVAQDTLRWVELLEAHIRRAPEQYLWLYKKFKRRPPPLPNLYAD